MKLMICPPDKKIEPYVSFGVTHFLLGMKDYSINCDCSFTLEEIRLLQSTYPTVEFFLLLNKNLSNHEVSDVENLLVELDKMAIAGVFFYDQAVLSICQRRGLSLPLVWNQTHMVTNYRTCQYYKDQGVRYAHLAEEITLDEMKEIATKSDIALIATVLGYSVMSHSNRKLLQNYFTYIQKEKEQKRYSLQETGKEGRYFVEEDETGTTFYQGALLNGTKALLEMTENHFEYALINAKEIPFSVLEKMIPLYQTILEKKEITDEEKETILKSSDEILKSAYTGFFFQKTIYKVKRNG